MANPFVSSMLQKAFEDVPETRRRNMAKIRSKNTGPEMAVRRLVSAMGYRYRLHGKNLPGKPDLVFQGRKKVIEVRGCFWHGHECRRGGRIPGTRADYWAPKIARNRQRDGQNISALKEMGWDILEVWECELGPGAAKVAERIKMFLGPIRLTSIRRPEATQPAQ